MAINGLGPMIQMMKLQAPSPTEVSQRIMGKVDKNGDGQLSADELNKLPKSGEMLLKADSNEDGQITEEELVSRISEKLETLKATMAEKQASGELPTIHELKALMAQMQEQAQASFNETAAERRNDRAPSYAPGSAGGYLNQFLQQRGVAQADIDALVELMQSKGFSAQA